MLEMVEINTDFAFILSLWKLWKWCKCICHGIRYDDPLNGIGRKSGNYFIVDPKSTGGIGGIDGKGGNVWDGGNEIVMVFDIRTPLVEMVEKLEINVSTVGF